MNGEYSKVNFPELRECRKLYFGNKTMYREALTNLANNMRKHGNFSTDRNHEEEIILLFMKNFYCVYNDLGCGNVENFYIDSKNLFDFLSDTEIKTTEDAVDTLFANKIPGHEIGVPRLFYGWIHSMGIERSILFMFSSIPKIGHNESYLVFNDGLRASLFVIDDRNIKYRNNKTYSLPEMIIMQKYTNMILNLFFYMSAFPENVLNKPPDVVCDKLNINNSKTISMSKEIADYLHENRDVSPHLRRGHFRYLGSDHYTKKRGQTIFVKSSFVKGHAVTVIENKNSVNEINNIL